MTDISVQLQAACKLSDGLVSIYVPELTVVKDHLCELTKKQEVVGRELQSENTKLSHAQFDTELTEMFVKVKTYKDKLINIKKKMTSLHERSVKLKKRALKLEQNKQSEAKQRAQQREKEEQLIGKTPEL